VDPLNKAAGCVDDGKNSALWFVGITPTLVSAAALVNPDKPTQAIANVPGVTANNDGSDTFGATASRFWLQAYQPTLQAQQWTWPTADSTPGSPVDVVTGLSIPDATARLTASGWKVKVITNFTCGSKEAANNVAFYGPHIAEPGATITLCISSGIAPQVYTPPSKTRGKPSDTATPTGPVSPPSSPSRHGGPPTKPTR
jgi:hypothetical protein